jgi:hypothetical protein
VSDQEKNDFSDKLLGRQDLWPAQFCIPLH